MNIQCIFPIIGATNVCFFCFFLSECYFEILEISSYIQSQLPLFVVSHGHIWTRFKRLFCTFVVLQCFVAVCPQFFTFDRNSVTIIRCMMSILMTYLGTVYISNALASTVMPLVDHGFIVMSK